MNSMRGAGVTWLFDLDNTLHDARPHVFPHINRSMTQYIMRHLELDEPAAGALRQAYWHRYGATLLGLMRHHDVDPHHFLWHTHQFPELARMVVSEAGLRHSLKRLPGRKILFSNSPRRYAEAVLRVLGVAGLFDGVHAIEATRFRPKPSIAGMQALLAGERLQPGRTVLVEDTLENLHAARRLGIRTVWITREARCPSWLDAKVASVLELPRVAHRLGVSR